MKQRDQQFYSMVLTVAELLQFGRVERFADGANGVQRQQDPSHINRMLKDLVDDPGTYFLENLQGDLQGRWEFDPATSSLIGREGAYITIDDGGHRFGLCQMLAEDDPELAAQWAFSMTCGMNSPYEQRLSRFLQQEKGKKIDTRLTLAQRARLGRLTPLEQEGWDLANMFNTDPRSPLYGLVIMDEQITRPYSQRSGRVRGVNITGLMTSFRSILSSRSPLKMLSRDNRRIVLMTYLQMVKETWPYAWKSEEHMLVSSTGIRAVLELIAKSPQFRTLVGVDFSQENLRRALSMAETFVWTVAKNKSYTLTQLIQHLDESLARNSSKKLAAKADGVVTLANAAAG